jgi:putative nucleotidyltransferase with HDIG domain
MIREETMHAGVQKDLELTVRELSDTYEELSLLYKLSEVLSGMSVDEIADKVVEEAITTLDVHTAAVLFFDEERERLVTKSFRGKWHAHTTIHKDDKIIWNAVSQKKPVAFCKLSDAGHSDYAHADGSILVCPLMGKAKVIGAIVLSDRKSDAEFYSNDIKLMMAIASQAAITVENALLYKELEDFLIAAIKSLVKALEASSRWTAGHTERVTEYALNIGAAMGLSGKHLERLRICSLLHDIGKIAVPREILDKTGKLTDDEEKVIRRHPLIAAEILGGFRQLQDVIHGIKYHHEWWDGQQSLLGLKGEDIPLMARILTVADCFDAMSSDRPYRRKKTREETTNEILSLSGKQFDPRVIDAFKQWVTQQHQVFVP